MIANSYNDRYNDYILFSVLSIIIFIITSFVVQTYLLLCFLFSVCMAMAFTFGKKIVLNTFRIQKNYISVLCASIIIVMLPMMHNGFFYGDDLWGFDLEQVKQHIAFSIGMRRPFNGILTGIFSNFPIGSSWVPRSLTIVILIFSTIILYNIVMQEHKNPRLAFAVAFISGCGTCAIDSIAYLSVNSVVYAMFLSIVSFYIYQSKGKKLWRICLSGFCLLGGFYFYQIITPIVFVLFVTSLYNEQSSKKDMFFSALRYLLFYFIVAIVYLISSQVIMQIYSLDVTQSSRAEFVRTLPGILTKIEWFIKTVIPQACLKLIGCLIGRSNFNTNILFYEISFINKAAGWTVIAVVLSLVAIYLLRLLFKKSFVAMLVALCAIVLSFYPFLILPESYPLSYYMLPIVIILGYYSICGIYIIYKNLRKILTETSIKTKVLSHLHCCKILKKVFGFIVALLFMMSVFQASQYANNWVTYSRDSYQYILQNIECNITQTTERICVIGRISPIVGGNPYVISAMELALKDLGYSPSDYSLKQADNEFYIAEISMSDMEKIQAVLSQSEYDRFISFYLHDQMYERYLYNNLATDEELGFIRKCLVKSNLIFFENSSTDLVISMKGFSNTHKF